MRDKTHKNHRSALSAPLRNPLDETEDESIKGADIRGAWMDIRSAPRDVCILILGITTRGRHFYGKGTLDPRDGTLYHDCPVEATHWMPLPPLPNTRYQEPQNVRVTGMVENLEVKYNEPNTQADAPRSGCVQ